MFRQTSKSFGCDDLCHNIVAHPLRPVYYGANGGEAPKFLFVIPRRHQFCCVTNVIHRGYHQNSYSIPPDFPPVKHLWMAQTPPTAIIIMNAPVNTEQVKTKQI